jgi:two-component system, LytTR family, response regulator
MGKTFSAIIVDDELQGRENLKTIFKNYCPEVKVLGTADSAISAKKLVDDFKPDVVFLDINMPVLNGFDFLSEFNDRKFLTVFVTAHEEYGINAVKVGAVDYILKPISIKELKQSVNRLLSLNESSKEKLSDIETDKVVLPDTHGFEINTLSGIIRLEADGCYTNIYFADGKKKIVSRTLKNFENNVPKEIFYRIHKSHIINVNYVKSYANTDGGSITMTDGSKITISRRRSPEFIRKIKTVLNSI